MSLASYSRRLKEMGWADRLLLVEATATLAVASIGIGILPFRKIVRTLSLPVAGEKIDRAADARAIARVRWAIEACARILPWRIVCFQKGLGMFWMLHRRNVPCLLHYGVAQEDQNGLRAHVWLTYEGEGIIGEEQAPEFTCLATFPVLAPSSTPKAGTAAASNK